MLRLVGLRSFAARLRWPSVPRSRRSSSSPVVFVHLRDLADLALQFRLPAISIFPQFAQAGGLIGYGPNVIDLFRRAARYVDQILKGAKASELPIQRPVLLDFALNLKTAQALGLTIPPSLLLRADQVIE